MIPYGRHYLDEADIEAVVDVLRSGALTQGPRIAEFEAAIASYVGARYAVAVSSGTAGLHLACMAANVGEGDLVVTSPITFVASANCARYLGAHPLFADIDPATLNLSAEAMRAARKPTDRVKAVIPVHFAGLPCDMGAIAAVAAEWGATVIEDAAHALGSAYPDGSRVGSCAYSSMTVFSFHPVKAIAAGEGGMITTNDEAIYRRLLRLRSHGINKVGDPLMNPDAASEGGIPNLWYYEMQELGLNYRITDIQAALALSQLGKIDNFVTRRRELAARYDNALSGDTALRPAQLAGRNASAHHLYPVRIDFSKAGMPRTEFMGQLRERGIGSQVHYIPVYRHPYYQSLGYRPGTCPCAEDYYREALSLPLYFTLSNGEQDGIVRALRDLLQ